MTKAKKTTTQKTALKISDSDQFISIGSRADEAAYFREWKPYYRKLRPGISLPDDRRNILPETQKKYKILAIGFGNWLSVDDRTNYVNLLSIMLADLNKVLGFRNNLGLGILGIGIGARGRSKALAHYEPNTNIINLTRYVRGDVEKEIRFLSTGGALSFAHEYGHFLDYIAGGYFDKNIKFFSLTNGDSTKTDRQHPTAKNDSLRYLMDNVMERIIFADVAKKKYSAYYNRLLVASKLQKSNYYIRRNEIFARAFEVYITHELNRKKIVNHLLNAKYRRDIYLSTAEMKKVAPAIRKLIIAIRGYVKHIK
jgi:hypothetical protein